MPRERIDLEEFLRQLIAILDKRLSDQEKSIKGLEREISAIKSKTPREVNDSVLRVLRGK
jgi:hypothetical protein